MEKESMGITAKDKRYMEHVRTAFSGKTLRSFQNPLKIIGYNARVVAGNEGSNAPRVLDDTAQVRDHVAETEHSFRDELRDTLSKNLVVFSDPIEVERLTEFVTARPGEFVINRFRETYFRYRGYTADGVYLVDVEEEAKYGFRKCLADYPDFAEEYLLDEPVERLTELVAAGDPKTQDADLLEEGAWLRREILNASRPDSKFVWYYNTADPVKELDLETEHYFINGPRVSQTKLDLAAGVRNRFYPVLGFGGSQCIVTAVKDQYEEEILHTPTIHKEVMELAERLHMTCRTITWDDWDILDC